MTNADVRRYRQEHPEQILSEPLSQCWGVVRGDYRSPNGAMRNAQCLNDPRFAVTTLDPKVIARHKLVGIPDTVAYCGIHVRPFGRPHSARWYKVEELKEVTTRTPTASSASE